MSKIFQSLVFSVFFTSIFSSIGFAEEPHDQADTKVSLKKFTAQDGSFSFLCPSDWKEKKADISPSVVALMNTANYASSCPFDIFCVERIILPEEVINLKELAENYKVGMKTIYEQGGRTCEWLEFEIIEDKKTDREILRISCRLKHPFLKDEIAWGILFSDQKSIYVLNGVSTPRNKMPFAFIKQKDVWQQLFGIYYSFEIQEKDATKEKSVTFNDETAPSAPKDKKVYLSEDKTFYFFYPSGWDEDDELKDFCLVEKIFIVTV